VINQRGSVRTKLLANVKLTHAELGEFLLQTSNISDAGAYVLAGEQTLPAVGETVTLQVQDLTGEDAPVLTMRIVREDKHGIGLVHVT
jgi:hypothetical protein